MNKHLIPMSEVSLEVHGYSMLLHLPKFSKTVGLSHYIK